MSASTWAYLLPGRGAWYEDVLAWLDRMTPVPTVLTYRSCANLVADLREGPGCVIADPSQPDARGVEIVQELRAVEGPQPSILLLAASPTVEQAVRCVKAGASDFLELPVGFERFREAFQLAVEEADRRGEHRRRLAAVEARFATLSAREGQVLDLLAEGRSSKAIATELNVSKRTIDYHRGQLMAKVGVDSSVELVSLVGELRRLQQGG